MSKETQLLKWSLAVCQDIQKHKTYAHRFPETASLGAKIEDYFEGLKDTPDLLVERDNLKKRIAELEMEISKAEWLTKSSARVEELEKLNNELVKKAEELMQASDMNFYEKYKELSAIVRLAKSTLK